jgi:hypothetical protein
MGTVDYMAPEQAQGQDTDGRSDVYALGCVLFQMLSGHVPFEKPNVMAKLWAQVNELPPRLDDFGDIGAVVERAMEKDPGRRFQSAGDLARAAAGAIGMPLPSSSAAATIPPRRATRRRLPRWTIAAAGVLAVAGVALALALGGGGSNGADEKPAIMAVLRRIHAGFSTPVCRNDFTENLRAHYFAPRSGPEALNACENLGGGDPDRKPLVVKRLTVQGDTASAQIDAEDEEPPTFYLVKNGGRWRVDDFTETARGRFQRRISTAIQPSFRITPDIEKFVLGKLRLANAGGTPARAVEFLRGAVKQVEGLQPPPGIGDIHRRLLAAMREQLAGAEDAVAAQKAGDAAAFKRAESRVFASIRALGIALDDLSRAQ